MMELVKIQNIIKITKSCQKINSNKISGYLVQFKKSWTQCNLANKNNMFHDNALW